MKKKSLFFILILVMISIVHSSDNNLFIIYSDQLIDPFVTGSYDLSFEYQRRINDYISFYFSPGYIHINENDPLTAFTLLAGVKTYPLGSGMKDIYLLTSLGWIDGYTDEGYLDDRKKYKYSGLLFELGIGYQWFIGENFIISIESKVPGSNDSDSPFYSLTKFLIIGLGIRI